MSNSDLIDSQDEYYDPTFYEIRLSIFFIAAVCVGLPCLVWAFYSVHRLRKAKGGISAFIVLLLLSDLLQLLLYPYIVTTLLAHYFQIDVLLIVIPGYLKICSLYLHQLVALETVLTLKYPTISAHMFSSPCYIIISIIILLFPIISIVLLSVRGFSCNPIEYLTLGSVLSCLCLLVVSGIIVYKAPPTAASTPVNHRPGSNVFYLSSFTLLVLYLPCVLLPCMVILHVFYEMVKSGIVMALCLLSLTVISESLLCVLVCRENLRAQGKHTQIEVNDEETAV